VTASRRIWRGCAPALFALIAVAAPAWSHPHVFIDYSATILCDADNVAAVRISWTFDEMYSASLYQDYTSRPHGPLSAADIQQLQVGAFQDTAELHYFTDVRLNGKPLDVKTVTDFDASYDQRKMTYRFTVPVDAGPPHDGDVLEIDAFDNEFYIDFELVKQNPIKIEHGNKLKLVCAPKKETRNTSVLGPVDTIIVSCKFGKAA
jgi:ABC-type uncharacterized transport system substrate-binding protein